MGEFLEWGQILIFHAKVFFYLFLRFLQKKKHFLLFFKIRFLKEHLFRMKLKVVCNANE